jgi:uncharacterized membrane protein
MRPDRFFLLASLLFGLAFAIVTPPFQVPDEPAHFYRSYAISEGDLSGRRFGGGWGGMLPASLWQLDTELRGDLPGHPERKIRPETIVRALRIPLDEERRVFVDYRTSAQLSFVPYLPQAAAIAVARTLGAPPLVLLYAARLVNLLVATALIAFALRRLPAFRWLFTLLALTPMALFLRGSLSADAFTIAVAFLLTATVARLAWGEDLQDGWQDGWQGGWKDVALLTACAAALCLTKPVYVPIAGLAFLIPSHRFPGGRRLPALAAFVTVTAAAFSLAVAIGSAMDLPLRLDLVVDRDRQIQDAFADPQRVAGILIRDYLQQSDRYVAQMVGQLGWLDLNLPKPFLWGFLLVLGLLVLCDGNREVVVRPWQRVLLGLIVIATLTLVSAAQYATWTPYGADFFEGIQGRYFLPLAPAAAWLLHNRRFRISPAVLSRAVPVLSVLFSLFAVWLVLRRYYGVG